MTRPFKFRAWNSAGRPYNMAYLCGFTYCGKNGKDIQGWFNKDSGFFVAPATEVFLMQFTGLLDKNGKEIYEGDIVELDTPSVQVEVVFKNGAFCVHGYNWDAKSCAVVGNIYENPELLP